MPDSPPDVALPPEVRLLLAYARTSAAGIDAKPLEGIDWPRFAKLASEHHVLPLIQKALSAASIPPELIPPEVRADLSQRTQQNTLRALTLMGELIRLLAAMDQIGVTAIPFKGPVLATSAYGDVALRHCGDLDLLIRPSDVRKAKQLLIDRGHELLFPTSSPAESAYLAGMSPEQESRYLNSHGEYHLFRHRDRLNIDLHWRMNPPELSLQVDEDAMWKRACPSTIGGREIVQLSPTDTLLMLCFNGSKDCWKRLDRICDIAELLRRRESEIDWDSAVEIARSLGGMRMLLLGIALANELLDAPLPPAMVERVRKDSRVAQLLAKVAAGLAEPVEILEMIHPAESAWFQLRVRERLRDRIKYCAVRLNPTVGDWAALSLPSGLSFFYYLLRPFRLAGRFGIARIRGA